MDPWKIFDKEQAAFTSLNHEYDIPLGAHSKERHGRQGTRIKTRNFESTLYQGAEDDKPDVRPSGRVMMQALFMLKRGPGKGDMSNQLKSLEDSLNRLAYDDDEQIDCMQLVRAFRQPEDRILVRIFERE